MNTIKNIHDFLIASVILSESKLEIDIPKLLSKEKLLSMVRGETLPVKDFKKTDAPVSFNKN